VLAQQQYNDIFPLLDFKEIAMCLQGCDLMASEELLVRPTQQYVTTLFEQIVDSFLGVSPDHLRASLDASARDMESPELQAESRATLGLQRLVYRFLVDCGIDDFNIMDIIKPEPQRFRRILSAVVNFARFREEHMGDCEDLVRQTEERQNKLQQLHEEREQLLAKIHELQQAGDKESFDDQVKRMQEHNAEVEGELRKLKKVQEQLTDEHGHYKQEKQRMVAKLQDQSYLIVEAKKENEKIRPYIVESPEMLHKINSEMNTSLQNEKMRLEESEKRARGLEISTDSFRLIEQDLKACIKAIEECDVEIQREEEANRKLSRYQELHEQRKLESHELDRKIQQLERQIANSEERIQRAKKQAEQKREGAQTKMAELRNTYATLVAERSVHTQDMDKKRHYIESTEEKMTEMRARYESEVSAILEQSEKLQSHISLYLDNVERKINVNNT
jgi:kinetochore protein Nuf2